MFKILITLLFSFHSLSIFAWDFNDFKSEFSSPVTTNAKYTFWTGTAITIGLVGFQEQVGKPFEKQTVRNEPLGDNSKYGDLLGQLIPNAAYVGGMLIASRFGNELAIERALGMFKATAYSSAVTTVLKYSIREPRPNNHSVRNSFPSGHSTTAFSFAGYVASEHGWAWGIPSILMATFVGYSRINDEAHRLHDVTAGATIGWAYGWGISKLRKSKNDQVYVAPILDRQIAGVSLYSQF